MLAWVEPAMWAFMRGLAFIMQLVGLLGLIVIGFALLVNLTDRIIEEEGNEDQYRSGEEDSPLQPGL